MQIYDSINYQTILAQAVEERKRIDSKFNFQKLASAARIQKSYLSRVIHGKAHLSTDQLFLICRLLRFTEKQTEYLELLLELAKCGVEDRKRKLTAQIRLRQKENLESKEHLEARAFIQTEDIGMYYLDPMNQIVHIALLIRRYRDNPALMARDLGVSPSVVSKAIQTLEKIGVVRRSGAKTRVVVDRVHLPKESEYYSVWRDQLKQMAYYRMKSLDVDDSYNFSVVFSADPDTQRKIRRKFLDFLKEVESCVAQAGDVDVFQMSFDLFPWTKN